MQKILIIEDEADVRKLLARRLAASRFEPLEAGDGNAGLQKAKEEKPDLIVLDLMLPGGDGFQVYKLIRQEPLLQTVPVIFLTAISPGGKLGRESVALIASTKHGLQLEGNYEAMGKPYDSKELLETIRRMLAVP